MSFLSIAVAGMFAVATLILLVGLARRIMIYSKVPAPLKIATTPAPTSTGGVVLRMFREVAFFESLFKSNKWIWLFGILFHLGLLLVLLRHTRYFLPTFAPIEWVQPFGKYAAFAMVAGLLGLWARRFLVDRVRYITQPSDHLILILLILIGISGAAMTFVSHVDVVGVKAFFTGLLTFSPTDIPADPLLIVHLVLVAILMIIFPFSKLLHGVGVFFSPTRNQVDNPREERHLSDWARKLEENS